MKDYRDVLVAPVVSEKSYGLLDENKYTFIVAPDANKTEIKIAVEKVFNVKVVSVNTMNRQGKNKKTRFGDGKRKDTKAKQLETKKANFGDSGQLKPRGRTELAKNTSAEPLG